MLNAGCVVLAQEIRQFALPPALGEPGGALVANRATTAEQLGRRLALIQIDRLGLVTCRRRSRRRVARMRPTRLREDIACQKDKARRQRNETDQEASLSQNRAPAAG